MSTFNQILDQMVKVHASKAEDYTRGRGEYFNFDEAAKQAGIDTAQAIEVLIGVKNARLIALRGTDTKPNNESIEDTLLDRAVYSIIALAHYRDTHYNYDSPTEDAATELMRKLNEQEQAAMEKIRGRNLP